MLHRLAGLPGRQAYEHRLKKLMEARRGGSVGVIHVDLDRFEDVNHALGHAAGDDLLVQAATRLRRLGCYVAWLGSDRFGLLADATEDPMELADRAIAVLAQPYPLGAHQVAITASAGVTEGNASAGVSATMNCANVARQWAKTDGRAICRWFDHDRNAREVKRCQLRLALPPAMACGEIALHYQPLVDLRSGQVIGAEALARWTHPVFGAIPPEIFIGIAEETDRIVALGAMLLHQACAAAATWRVDGDRSPPFVSVNVAAAQLRDPTFFTTVSNTLEHTGLPPGRLQLEITEHSFVASCQRTLHNLRSLEQLGVRIAVDDFGTGYSNLATLLRLPIHELKLAHSFIRDGSPNLLTQILQFGRSLNLTMTAEGIETERQATLLRTLGCDAGQGWHFSRPLTAERIRQYICANSARLFLAKGRARRSRY